MGFLDIFKASKNKRLTQELSELQQKYDDLKASQPKEKKDFDDLIEKSEILKSDIAGIEAQKSELQLELDRLNGEVLDLREECQSKRNELSKTISDTQKLRALYQQYHAAAKGYEKDPDSSIPDIEAGQELLSMIEVDLNCMNVRDLRKRFQKNQRKIQKVFKRYEHRYTTKANRAIYQLMVIAMEAELQNVLVTLSYGKLDKAVDNIKSITKRYYEVAVEGNQSIAPTMKSFIAEIEFLFIEGINIEYEYFVKREQEREEQRAIREQMRQEAEERKALEAERKKVEREEAKYNAEIQQLNEKIEETSDSDKIQQLEKRIAELQAQMAEVQRKKEEIINLQNGKAGYVYVISNLGSFGRNIFKIGMTRRLEPMERVKELSNASVPFSFDVHSFIFSQDAVALESTLHKALNENRVNKVNLRKEFFRVSIDDLEKLVYKHDPTAEFKRTMLAEQYHQSRNRTKVVPEIQSSSEDTEEDEDS